MIISDLLKRWWNNILGLNIDFKKEFELDDFSIDKELISLQKVWRGIEDGEAEWNDENTPPTMLAKGISKQLAVKTTVELLCNINSGIVDESQSESKMFNPFNNEITYIENKKSKILNDSIQEFVNNPDKLDTAINLLYNCGTVLLKPYVKKDKVYTRVIRSEDYLTVSKNERGDLTKVIIPSFLDRGDKRFLLLELVSFDEETEVNIIEYKAFVSDKDSRDFRRISLTDVPQWSNLQEYMVFKNTPAPLFLEMRIMGNKPIWADSVEHLKQADKQYGRVLWEYEGGELAFFATDLTMKKVNVQDGFAQNYFEMPKGKERLFMSLFRETDTGLEKPFDNEWSPNLRDENLWRGLNEIKRMIEFTINLSYATVSEADAIVKTATELDINLQNTLAFVGKQQQMLKENLDKLIFIYDMLTSIYNLCPNEDYNVSISFGDGVKKDDEKEFQYTMQLANAGYIDSVYAVAQKFGISPEQAELMKPKLDDIIDDNDLIN